MTELSTANKLQMRRVWLQQCFKVMHHVYKGGALVVVSRYRVLKEPLSQSVRRLVVLPGRWVECG